MMLQTSVFFLYISGVLIKAAKVWLHACVENINEKEKKIKKMAEEPQVWFNTFVLLQIGVQEAIFPIEWL